MFYRFSDSVSVASNDSDELNVEKISNMQEVIEPHPKLVKRMYFVWRSYGMLLCCYYFYLLYII